MCCVVVVEDQLVVNLVGENDQIVAARQFRNCFQHAARAHGAGRIVGIDQHNAARARTDLLVHVDQVRLPAVVFVQGVGVELDAEFASTAE